MGESQKTVKVGNLTIGEGKPKICAPLVAPDIAGLAADARGFAGRPIDLAEWRMDCFAGVRDAGEVRAALEVIRENLPEIPLLCTFRTAREGGNTKFTDDEYIRLNRAILDTGLADILDVEFGMGEEIVSELIGDARSADVKIVLSNHDFCATPPGKEIVRRLCGMQSLGADIAKLAAMPSCYMDAVTLLAATAEMRRRYARIPLITMAMGRYGVFTRVLGERYGSAVTFGSAGKASAPGQMEAEELAGMLEKFHEAVRS